MQADYHWYVLGPGAISGLIASHLLEAKQQCSALTREKESKHGQLTLKEGTISSTYTLPFLPTQKCQLTKDAVFIVAVKAFDVVNALESITAIPGFDKDMPIILSHNGMLELPNSLTSLNIYHLVTTHGAVKLAKEPTHIVIEHRGKGRSWLQQKENKADFEAILAKSFKPIIFESDIQTRRWSKLLINCVINPLTAIHQCNNGELLKAEWQEVIQSLVDEAVCVARVEQVNLDAKSVYEEILRVAGETRNNESSMLQDIRYNRRTEIDYLTGYIIKKAKKAGLKTPAHEKLMKDFISLYPQ
ncbi:2-dehydropantoate 2-reductase [Idiomarina piscisalsi]|uniref:2-dehydropantoate 2-reductase n=1 Tax=Idiomarina piscisalsi TaxID=1096243 RepID=UPI001381B2D6|nr:2-dehydropantoate 2-reductase [Idiomarina piscisalsi]MTJ02395.1 2-dehydropantoate 2-reductase [Idiomarina piscisalsi]